MYKISMFLLLLSFSFNLLAESSLFTQRGLIKEIYSEPDTIFKDTWRTLVRLKGMGERATCRKIKLNEFDKAGLEILKMSLQVNRPVEITFHIAKGNSEEVEEIPFHCQAETISLKP